MAKRTTTTTGTTVKSGDRVTYTTKLTGRQPVEGVIVRGPYVDRDLGIFVVAAYSAETHAVSILPVGRVAIVERATTNNAAERVEAMRRDYESTLRQYPAWVAHFEKTPTLADHLFADNPWIAAGAV